MNGFLLAIMISSATGMQQDSIPLGLFTDVQDCIHTASRIVDSGILKDEHDVWCIPVKIQDGYANGDGELEVM